jgi:hypothetical protein
MTFKGNKIMGMTPITLPNSVTCISSAEGAGGNEEIYFGSTDGYVYQMERGTSFDGAAITWSAELAFNHIGTPRQLKTFRKAVTEVTGSGYCEFSFTHSLAPLKPPTWQTNCQARLGTPSLGISSFGTAARCCRLNPTSRVPPKTSP